MASTINQVEGLSGMTSIRILFAASLLTLVSISSSYAVEAFEGIDIQKIVVSGQVYEVPVGNKDRKDDIFYIKKAMKGDREALEMFLGGNDSRIFYIGKESPVWLYADINGKFKVLDKEKKNV